MFNTFITNTNELSFNCICLFLNIFRGKITILMGSSFELTRMILLLKSNANNNNIYLFLHSAHTIYGHHIYYRRYFNVQILNIKQVKCVIYHLTLKQSNPLK